MAFYGPQSPKWPKWMPKDRTEQVNIRHGHCCANDRVVRSFFGPWKWAHQDAPGQSSGQSFAGWLGWDFVKRSPLKGATL